MKASAPPLWSARGGPPANRVAWQWARANSQRSVSSHTHPRASGMPHRRRHEGLPGLAALVELTRAADALQIPPVAARVASSHSPVISTSVRPHTCRHMDCTAWTCTRDRRISLGRSAPNRPVSTWMWLACASS